MCCWTAPVSWAIPSPPLIPLCLCPTLHLNFGVAEHKVLPGFCLKCWFQNRSRENHAGCKFAHFTPNPASGGLMCCLPNRTCQQVSTPFNIPSLKLLSKALPAAGWYWFAVCLPVNLLFTILAPTRSVCRALGGASSLGSLGSSLCWCPCDALATGGTCSSKLLGRWTCEVVRWSNPCRCLWCPDTHIRGTTLCLPCRSWHLFNHFFTFLY